jgi:hypothetical protein
MMALDRRLREGFERSSSSIEERSNDRVLGGVVARGRRRRRARRVAAGSLAVAAVMAGVAIAPKALDAIRGLRESRPASPQELLRQIAGTYTIEVDQSGGAIESFEMAGTWTVSLLRNGEMEITPPPAFLRSWDQPTGDVFTLTAGTLRANAFGQLCADSIGTYMWTLRDDRLSLAPLTEDCEARKALFTASTWVRQRE